MCDRECSLDEWVASLPPEHRVLVELRELRMDLDCGGGIKGCLNMTRPCRSCLESEVARLNTAMPERDEKDLEALTSSLQGEIKKLKYRFDAERLARKDLSHLVKFQKDLLEREERHGKRVGLERRKALRQRTKAEALVAELRPVAEIARLVQSRHRPLSGAPCRCLMCSKLRNLDCTREGK